MAYGKHPLNPASLQWSIWHKVDWLGFQRLRNMRPWSIRAQGTLVVDNSLRLCCWSLVVVEQQGWWWGAPWSFGCVIVDLCKNSWQLLGNSWATLSTNPTDIQRDCQEHDEFALSWYQLDLYKSELVLDHGTPIRCTYLVLISRLILVTIARATVSDSANHIGLSRLGSSRERRSLTSICIRYLHVIMSKVGSKA